MEPLMHKLFWGKLQAPRHEKASNLEFKFHNMVKKHKAYEIFL